MKFDRLWINAHLATMHEGLGVILNGALACKEGRINFVGPVGELPHRRAEEIIDCQGRWITPGLIDCHTHLVFSGDRALEFEQRLNGASYEEIAHSGGGIAHTVRATRNTSVADLVTQTLPRLDHLLNEGVTTVEIKSGYGLNFVTEQKILQAARELSRLRTVNITTTFLGAHALAPEFIDKDAYCDAVCDMIPRLAKERLVDAVDGFCETIAFDPVQIARVFQTAQRYGLPVKLHADQLSNMHGAALAARFGALSADHLEYCDEEGAEQMAKSGTVAVVLPGAFYFLRESTLPPINAFRRLGVTIALASDCNPGTSPLTSLLLTMNMGATLFRLTVEECLLGVTRHAAMAIGRHDIGRLAMDYWCDLAIWNIKNPAELVYRMGFNPLHQRIWKGQ